MTLEEKYSTVDLHALVKLTSIALVFWQETEWTPTGWAKMEDVAGDPGGPTKFGIDQKDYASVDVKALTFDHAFNLYAKVYENWGISDLPALSPIPVFSAGVNIGTGRATEILQKILGVHVDGVLGPETRRVARCQPWYWLCMEFCHEWTKYYLDLVAKNPSMEKFLRGWLRRVEATKDLINTLQGWVPEVK